MEVERRLIGQHIDVIMMHVHAIGHLLDDDAALAVADEPVQQRLLLSRHDLGDERHVPERLLDLVDGVEITRHPQRKFERGDVFRAFDRFVDERGVAGKFKPAMARPCSLAQSKYIGLSAMTTPTPITAFGFALPPAPNTVS